ncbi:unnamed protein product [Fusarium venenatum]|uniref:Uncharacterized protein n=1 Tax=Fusarium venenatum TaxID=56646 RepID=A0A2L2TVT8_9HYPO|nr:uncharacterized protein FVRRES_02232 [Fusarium venenatum]CEI65720.1 unnamed protein product [Fusarium venenatum]
MMEFYKVLVMVLKLQNTNITSQLISTNYGTHPAYDVRIIQPSRVKFASVLLHTTETGHISPPCW